MRWYRGPDGSDRIWFDLEEIESLAEGELGKASLLPTIDTPVVDMEAFIEGHLGARLDQHAALEPDVLGMTQFPLGLPAHISINRDLTHSALDTEAGPPGLRGRWRATLAHEAAHVLMHQVLFDLNPNQGTLFDSPGADGGLLRCLKREVTFAREAPDWREVQANRGMASLLMPRSVFIPLARRECERLGLVPGSAPQESAPAQEAVVRVAEWLEVSRQAAGIRFATLGIVRPVSQGAL